MLDQQHEKKKVDTKRRRRSITGLKKTNTKHTQKR